MRNRAPKKQVLRYVVLVFCATTWPTLAVAGNLWPYDPSPLYPFGLPNPAQTDSEARVFDSMIGAHRCRHERVDYETRKVTRAEAVWTWYYDMNGYGIRDHYRYEQGAPASQRIFNPDTRQWHIWYFLGQDFYYVGEWVGGAEGGKLVFEKADEEIAGRLFLSRLEYYDIRKDSFKWKSTNIDNVTGDEFVDWRIECERF